MKVDFTQGKWLFKPGQNKISAESVIIVTEPGTDFWQRTYYGFRNHNAPALLLEAADNFTFTTKVTFSYKTLFDQCGVIIYLDSDNWFKASIEYENQDYARLGSVVTNLGHSDWATTDISLPDEIWYRLHRRGPDFLIESSLDGNEFRQMRIFHLQQLGETTERMGKCDPPVSASNSVKFGLYACSPSDSSFTAKFTDMDLTDCQWRAHTA